MQETSITWISKQDIQQGENLREMLLKWKITKQEYRTKINRLWLK